VHRCDHLFLLVFKCRDYQPMQRKNPPGFLHPISLKRNQTLQMMHRYCNTQTQSFGPNPSRSYQRTENLALKNPKVGKFSERVIRDGRGLGRCPYHPEYEIHWNIQFAWRSHKLVQRWFGTHPRLDLPLICTLSSIEAWNSIKCSWQMFALF